MAAPAGAYFARTLLFSLALDAIPCLEPLGAGLPRPPVAGGVAYRERPEVGVRTEQVAQVSLPAEIERAGELRGILLVEVLFVPTAGLQSLVFVVRQLHFPRPIVVVARSALLPFLRPRYPR